VDRLAIAYALRDLKIQGRKGVLSEADRYAIADAVIIRADADNRRPWISQRSRHSLHLGLLSAGDEMVDLLVSRATALGV
jgi:hypothetical protein